MALRASAGASFAFGDLSLVPRIAHTASEDVDLQVQLAPGLVLQRPFLASPMDTVTDASVARRLSALGAFAILHCSYPDRNEQVREIRRALEPEAHQDGAAALDIPLTVGALIPTELEITAHVERLIEAGVSLVAIDSIHVAPHLHLQVLELLKRRFPELAMMSGNVVHPEDCRRLIESGVDCIRVGYGSGSINNGHRLLGMGRPLAKAIAECAPLCRKLRVPLVADGGISSDGEIALALALGASVVMLGRMFAACHGTPGEVFRNEEGELVKLYRGMSRTGLLAEGVPAEGKSMLIPCRTTLEELVEQLTNALQVSVSRSACRSLEDFYDKSEVELLTPASRQELGFQGSCEGGRGG